MPRMDDAAVQSRVFHAGRAFGKIIRNLLQFRRRHLDGAASVRQLQIRNPFAHLGAHRSRPSRTAVVRQLDKRQTGILVHGIGVVPQGHVQRHRIGI